MSRLFAGTTILGFALLAVACGGGATTSAPTASTPPAATAAPAPVAENVEQTIDKLEHDWVKAIVAKDAATVSGLLSDDFIGTTDQTMYSKEDAIEDVKSGVHEKLDLDNLLVRPYGNTAVATMSQTEKSHHGTEDFSGRFLFTDVWVKKDGQWHAVSSHGSRAR